MAIVGIDLGTTNSLISYWNNEAAVIIPNALGSKLTPSVVSVDETGEILVGQIAKERLCTHPQMTAAGFKRFMGTSKKFPLGKYEFFPQELSSFVIRALKQDAEAYLGEPVSEAVISVPAYFNDAQRKATKLAGELAGLQVERLINEPTAAAVAYGIHQQAAETKFLIFDLGGGTFDVSVVELFENVMEVKAVAGDNYLGGEDFTDVLVALFLEHHHISRGRTDPKSHAFLRKQAELCKRALNQADTGSIRYTMNDMELEWVIGRQEFNLASKSLVSRLRQPVERALRDAAIRPDELDAVILVGGATRMPLVHTLVSRLFSRFPANSLNPDEVVAQGAGIMAAMKERNAMLKETVLTDVCPYTLGIGVAVKNESSQYESGHYAPIIERNTLIPVSRVERFFTIGNNQKHICIEAFQGESRLTKNNLKLGQFQIGVPPAPAGEQAIDVRFTYDINGILEVEATVLSTGVQERVVIEESPGALSKEEIAHRLEMLADIKVHPRDRQENQALLARGERLYEELLGCARNQVGAALQKFERAINSQNDREIKHAAHIFRAKLDELENNQE